jgi:hypothetical protein
MQTIIYTIDSYLYYRLIWRYRRHYGSKVNWSKKRKQDVIAFVKTVTQLTMGLN